MNKINEVSWQNRRKSKSRQLAFEETLNARRLCQWLRMVPLESKLYLEISRRLPKEQKAKERPVNFRYAYGTDTTQNHRCEY